MPAELKTLEEIGGFDEVYGGSFYTILGCADPTEYMEGYEEELAKIGVKPAYWVLFTGDEVNREYGLTGDNAFQENLNILAFPLIGNSHEALGRLAMFKLKWQDKWFNDLADNSIERENMKRGF